MRPEDAEVVVALGCLLHCTGMAIHRRGHEDWSLFLAADLLPRLLDGRVRRARADGRDRPRCCRRSSRTGADGSRSSLEAGIVRVADALDMAKGRSRIPFEAGRVSMHSLSAAAIEAVHILPGAGPPGADRDRDEQLGRHLPGRRAPAPKLRGSGLEPCVEVVARIEDGGRRSASSRSSGSDPSAGRGAATRYAAKGRRSSSEAASSATAVLSRALPSMSRMPGRKSAPNVTTPPIAAGADERRLHAEGAADRPGQRERQRQQADRDQPVEARDAAEQVRRDVALLDRGPDDRARGLERVEGEAREHQLPDRASRGRSRRPRASRASSDVHERDVAPGMPRWPISQRRRRPSRGRRRRRRSRGRGAAVQAFFTTYGSSTSAGPMNSR